MHIALFCHLDRLAPDRLGIVRSGPLSLGGVIRQRQQSLWSVTR